MRIRAQFSCIGAKSVAHFSFSFSSLDQEMKVNFMTFNIRHDPGGEIGKFTALPSSLLGEQPWSLRKYKVADTVLMWSPDIVGFQVKHENTWLQLHTC